MATSNPTSLAIAKQQNTSLEPQDTAEIMERVLLAGDLAKLTPDERLRYYNAVCRSVGLNPLTRPFDYISLNNKLTLYAKKDATDQLRQLREVSITELNREMVEGLCVVTAHAKDATGRTDIAVGAVHIENLKGEARANAMMKCETKAKRRVTLSICGLGWLDETELETIPSARAPQAEEPAREPAPQEPVAALVAGEVVEVTLAGEVPLIPKADLLKVIKLTDRLSEYGMHEEEWRDLIEKETGQRSRKLIEAGDLGKVLIALSGTLNELIKAKSKNK